MGRSVFAFLIALLLIEGLSFSEDGLLSPGMLSYSTMEKGFVRSHGERSHRSLLSIPMKHGEGIVAVPDGTVYLVERYSGKLLWSFNSGSSIYTSYQAPIEEVEEEEENNSSRLSRSFFFDCGDDWDLYIHDRHLGERMKLKMTIEDVIRRTPQILEDGGVMLGSKRTTVFLVDSLSGKVIKHYADPAGANVSSSDIERLKRSKDSGLSSLYVTRRDYSLQAFFPNSSKVLWNMTVAEFGATLLCSEEDDSSSSITASSSSSSSSSFSPLSCHSEMTVHRFRSHDTLSSGILSIPSVDTPVLLSEQSPISIPVVSAAAAASSSSSDLQIKRRRPFSLFLFPFLIALLAVASVFFVDRKRTRRTRSEERGPAQAVSRRKRNRRASGNANGGDEMLGEKEIWWNRNGISSGRRIGNLLVTETEIAKGSNGTVVFEGVYAGRRVAVKRLVRAHHGVAFKEIQNLIASDHHPNIVRWYGVEFDPDFIYLSLERCTCSLNDFVQAYSRSSLSSPFPQNHHQTKAAIDYHLYLNSLKDAMGDDLLLWNLNGSPSPLLLKLMREVVCGVAHLHELGMVHRDLKPQNVLIGGERSVCAKISDMGISKTLYPDASSLGNPVTGYGSSGWQAPEQIRGDRQTRAVDVFSLGCVMFFCMTGGSHPFGQHIERDVNILRNQPDLFLLESVPEALDLLSRLLHPDPTCRPKAVEVVEHPLFWSSERRLGFLRESSDRIEMEERDVDSDMLTAVELALDGRWDERLDPLLIADIGRYRRYRFDSVRDLLRVMRNKLNHFRELPLDVQGVLGNVPEGFDAYFGTRFPKLLMQVYRVMHRFCKEEEGFRNYFSFHFTDHVLDGTMAESS